MEAATAEAGEIERIGILKGHGRHGEAMGFDAFEEIFHIMQIATA